MPKTKWAIDPDEPEDLEGWEEYDGPVPPAGIYVGYIRRLGVKENKNGDDMLNGLFIIDEDKDSEKSRFNGYGIWFNQNVTDQGKPFLKQFLGSIGATWSDFVSRTVTESKDRPTDVVSIGKVKLESEPEARLSAKRGSYNGEAKLEVARWMPPKTDEEQEEWDDSDAEPADGDEPGF